jgi:hypothetical protein
MNVFKSNDYKLDNKQLEIVSDGTEGQPMWWN